MSKTDILILLLSVYFSIGAILAAILALLIHLKSKND